MIRFAAVGACALAISGCGLTLEPDAPEGSGDGGASDTGTGSLDTGIDAPLPDGGTDGGTDAGPPDIGPDVWPGECRTAADCMDVRGMAPACAMGAWECLSFTCVP